MLSKVLSISASSVGLFLLTVIGVIMTKVYVKKGTRIKYKGELQVQNSYVDLCIQYESFLTCNRMARGTVESVSKPSGLEA